PPGPARTHRTRLVAGARDEHAAPGLAAQQPQALEHRDRLAQRRAAHPHLARELALARQPARGPPRPAAHPALQLARDLLDGAHPCLVPRLAWSRPRRPPTIDSTRCRRHDCGNWSDRLDHKRKRRNYSRRARTGTATGIHRAITIEEENP